MELDQDHSLEEARARISFLTERITNATAQPDEALSEALEELSVLIEELNQADSQLRVNYEELLQTREKLVEERKRYQELFEFAPDAYLVTNVYGTIEQANQKAAELIRVRQDFLVGKPINLFINRNDWKTLFGQAKRGQSLKDFELTLLPRNGQSIIASVNLEVVSNLHDEPVAFRWLLRDITEQKKAQTALASSETRFRTIFQGAETGMVLTDLNGIIVESNPAFQWMLGADKGSLRSIPIASLSRPSTPNDPNEPVLDHSIAETLLSGEQEHTRVEKRFLSMDGKEIWTRLTISLLHDDNMQPVYLVYMVENITPEKQTAEELIEIKRRLQQSSEVERLHLAQELHDGPMQDLYGAVFKLTMTKTLVDEPAMLDELKEMEDTLKQVAGTLRTICGELRPPTLANLGLEKAIRSHAEKLRETHPNLNILLDLENDERALSQDTRLALFRIYQQGMINVLRHAKAKQVEVRFYLTDAEAHLHVNDDGNGFILPDKWLDLLRQGHYGLAGIAERTQVLGGKFTVQSAPGEGTRIHVMVPRK